jgi:sterol 22-desaturase
MASAAQNASFTSPLADAKYAHIVGNSQIDGVLSTISGLSGWTIALTLFALVVAYDQSKDSRRLKLCFIVLIHE